MSNSIVSSISSTDISIVLTSTGTLGSTSVPTSGLIPTTDVIPTSVTAITSLLPSSSPTSSSISIELSTITPTSTSSSSFLPISSNVASTPSTSTPSTSITPIPSTSPTPSVSPTPTTNTDISDTVTVVSTVTSTPTTLINSPSNSNLASRRTAVITGTTIGCIAFILMLLAAIFVYRRHKLRKALEFPGKKEGRGLLDGEEFDDDERNFSTSTRSYSHPFQPATFSTLNLMKSRTSETGSMFREEVWPPPGFIDPISKQNSQVDLSGIVDDVMGPGNNPSSPTSSSSTSYSGPSAASRSLRQPTDTSTVSAYSSTSTSALITDKDQMTSPLSASESRIQGHFPSPSVASAPVLSSPPPIPPPTRSPMNTQPRKSSPLARPLSGDSKLWLTRNVRPPSQVEDPLF